MKNKLCIILLFLFASSIVGETHKTNNFSKIKEKMNSAGCIKIEFISIFMSMVFDTIDSTNGSAVISQDGSYYIQIGTDIFINDLKKSYSYSEETNQVIIKNVVDPEMIGNEISFIKNLDELYITKVVENNRIYKLNQIESDNKLRDIPDSMIIFISGNKHFDSLSFFDHNEDLNLICFLNQEMTDTCLESYFIPNFPDSVEKIRY